MWPNNFFGKKGDPEYKATENKINTILKNKS